MPLLIIYGRKSRVIRIRPLHTPEVSLVSVSEAKSPLLMRHRCRKAMDNCNVVTFSQQLCLTQSQQTHKTFTSSQKQYLNIFTNWLHCCTASN